MARISNVLLVAMLVMLAVVMVSCAPPVSKHIKKATTAEKMKDIKLASTSKASSQALQEADNATAADDDSDSEQDEPDGIADDESQQAKIGFFKNIIGGGMTPGTEDHHPSKDIPTLVYLLPVVGFIGVGLAIGAYCMFGT